MKYAWNRKDFLNELYKLPTFKQGSESKQDKEADM